MGVGFVMGRTKLITQKGTTEMSSVLINVAAPCVILTTFQMDWDVQFLITLGTGSLAMLGCYILFALIVRLFFRKQMQVCTDSCFLLLFTLSETGVHFLVNVALVCLNAVE